jgi:pimeloyl-ACP methyl ester carboxylesterase
MESLRVGGTHVLASGPVSGPPVLLIHGNCWSAASWAPLWRQLPAGWRVVAPDLRGYGASGPAPVDATRGLRDFADDVAALLDAGLFAAGARPVVVGHSMGGGVATRLTIDHPGRVGALLLESPISPRGFGGVWADDFAGTGAGAVNPDFVKRLAAGDRSTDAPTSPRNVMYATYVADPASFGDDGDALLDSLLTTVTGEGNYPGDAIPTTNWPGAAPGSRGVVNAMSPKYLDHTALADIDPRPPVVWVRGDLDVIVSDNSGLDLAVLGRAGLIPGYPGCSPQPMVGQTRELLERYAAAGGRYTEIVLPGCGHSPHVERPAEFAAVLRELVG